jgi:hypothetical protein
MGIDRTTMVALVLAAADESSFLEVVDQGDHGGAVDAHPAGYLSLGQRVRAVDGAEHGGFPAVDPGGRERGGGELEEAQVHVLEQVPEVLGHRGGRLAAGWRAARDLGGHGSSLRIT